MGTYQARPFEAQPTLEEPRGQSHARREGEDAREQQRERGSQRAQEHGQDEEGREQRGARHACEVAERLVDRLGAQRRVAGEPGARSQEAGQANQLGQLGPQRFGRADASGTERVDVEQHRIARRGAASRDGTPGGSLPGALPGPSTSATWGRPASSVRRRASASGRRSSPDAWTSTSVGATTGSEALRGRGRRPSHLGARRQVAGHGEAQAQPAQAAGRDDEHADADERDDDRRRPCRRRAREPEAPRERGPGAAASRSLGPRGQKAAGPSRASIAGRKVSATSIATSAVTASPGPKALVFRRARCRRAHRPGPDPAQRARRRPGARPTPARPRAVESLPRLRRCRNARAANGRLRRYPRPAAAARTSTSGGRSSTGTCRTSLTGPPGRT